MLKKIKAKNCVVPYIFVSLAFVKENVEKKKVQHFLVLARIHASQISGLAQIGQRIFKILYINEMW